jgi:hypothetical protein
MRDFSLSRSSLHGQARLHGVNPALGVWRAGWPSSALAGVVTALPALGALVFAWLTVRDARALRREGRRAHLLDLAADVGEAGRRAFGESDRRAFDAAQIARLRFRAAIDSTGKELPACRALLAIEWWPPTTFGGHERRTEEADRALTAALDELAAWLRD